MLSLWSPSTAYNDVVIVTCHLQHQIMSGDLCVAEQRWFADGDDAIHPYSAPTKCLAVMGGRDDDSQPLQVEDCNGSKGQKWTPSGSMEIFAFAPKNQSLQSGLNGAMCVDVWAPSFSNLRQLVTWPCNGLNNQRFKTDSVGALRSTHNPDKCVQASLTLPVRAKNGEWLCWARRGMLKICSSSFWS